MLYQISKSLQEAKPQNSTLPFAGVSIVLMDDFAQLPPVTDHPLFEEKAGTRYQLFGRHLYSSLFKVNFSLTQSMRQRGEDQQMFRNILNKIANGSFDEKLWRSLANINSEKDSSQF